MAALSTCRQRAGAAWLLRCEECDAQLAPDQRYCVECGGRRGPLPPDIAEAIGGAARRARDRQGAAGEGLAGADGSLAGAGDDHASRTRGAPTAETPDSRRAEPIPGLAMPAPPAAAVAVMSLLAFGVLVGSTVSPAQPSSAEDSVLLAVSPSQTASGQTAATTPAAQPEPTPAPSSPASPAAAPGQAAEASTTSSTAAASQPPPGQAGAPTATAALPPVKHVFLIVLSDQGYEAAFGPSSQAPYLSKTLTHQGELLENYYGIGGGELANAIALISGQGPNPQTLTDCPQYTDLTPGTPGDQGQTLGSGCVYPARTLTLADQLADEGRTWRAYVEGVSGGGPGQPASCRRPQLGAADPYRTPRPGDPYVTWRNPFVYFHSLIDGTSCSADDVGLERLAPDLKEGPRAPTLAYIVPDRCHDGSEQPCAARQPAGLTAADAFLRQIVPEIEASPAYGDGGLIAITFDQAPQTGPNADSSGCCIASAYPNLPATTASPATGTPTATTTTPGTPTTPGAPTTPNTPTTPSTTTTPNTTTAPATAAAGTPAGPAGGGRVGLLLISKYVKPGSVDAIDDYDHFSLLRSIEGLFGLAPLGYAGTPSLLAFDKSVFNAYR